MSNVYENSLIVVKTYILSNPIVLESCSGSLFLVKGAKNHKHMFGKK